MMPVEEHPEEHNPETTDSTAPDNAAEFQGGGSTVDPQLVAEGLAEETAADASMEMVAEGGPPEPVVNPNMRWYILHAYSGFEEKVRESLLTRGQAFGFGDKIGQVLIPKEDVIELRKGNKVTTKRLVYPGYVLVQMEMSDDLWHRVKETPRVTGFLGGGNVPTPLTDEEVDQILNRQKDSAERPRPKMNFEKNEMVRIVDGPFNNFTGKVDDVNSERNTLRVLVTIFGRATPVELDFLQVEKN